MVWPKHPVMQLDERYRPNAEGSQDKCSGNRLHSLQFPSASEADITTDAHHLQTGGSSQSEIWEDSNDTSAVKNDTIVPNELQFGLNCHLILTFQVALCMLVVSCLSVFSLFQFIFPEHQME